MAPNTTSHVPFPSESRDAVPFLLQHQASCWVMKTHCGRTGPAELDTSSILYLDWAGLEAAFSADFCEAFSAFSAVFWAWALRSKRDLFRGRGLQVRTPSVSQVLAWPSQRGPFQKDVAACTSRPDLADVGGDLPETRRGVPG